LSVVCPLNFLRLIGGYSWCILYIIILVLFHGYITFNACIIKYSSGYWVFIVYRKSGLSEFTHIYIYLCIQNNYIYIYSSIWSTFSIFLFRPCSDFRDRGRGGWRPPETETERSHWSTVPGAGKKEVDLCVYLHCIFLLYLLFILYINYI
jgi:hypothetical protein